MGLARTLAVTLTGLTGHIVDVEAHATQGLPGFTLVGLPDAAVRALTWDARCSRQNLMCFWMKRITFAAALLDNR